MIVLVGLFQFRIFHESMKCHFAVREKCKILSGAVV